MLAEKREHRFLVVHRVPVSLGTYEQVDVLFRRVQTLVKRAYVLVCLAQATRVEIVEPLPHQEHGLGRCGDDKVGHLKPLANHSRRALLCIARQLVLQVTEKRRHETARRRHGKPVLDRPQPGGHRPPTRVPGDADARRVYLGPAQHIVERAHTIPGAPHSQVLPNQLELLAHHVVRTRTPADLLPVPGPIVLIPLALAIRIVDQHHETGAGQPL